MIGRGSKKGKLLADYFLNLARTPVYKDIMQGMEEDLMRYKDDKQYCLKLIRAKIQTSWDKLIQSIISRYNLYIHLS